MESGFESGRSPVQRKILGWTLNLLKAKIPSREGNFGYPICRSIFLYQGKKTKRATQKVLGGFDFQ